ncbi:enoyl-CoA hydratase/isomerase family protein [Rhodococcus sp. C26F]
MSTDAGQSRSANSYRTDTDAPAALIERHGAVGVITFNRPRSLNAVNSALSTTVGRALEVFDGDPEIRAVVVTGAGRAFCAGADLKEVAAQRSFLDPDHPEWGLGGLVHHPFTKPLVAAVNGLALGGGAEMVMSCDLAVMDEDARLGLPEIHQGLIPGAGGLIRFPRIIAPKRAMELALLGEAVGAEEASALGLVNRVAPRGQCLEHALELAARLAAQSPVAARLTKQLVRAAYDPPRSDDPTIWQLEGDLVSQILADPDARARTRAFATGRRTEAGPSSA